MVMALLLKLLYKCVAGMIGEKENPLQHVQRAVLLQPNLAAEARKDDNFESLHAGFFGGDATMKLQ
jgi:hypothetical protein